MEVCVAMRAAIYLRVSTTDQHVENQRADFVEYCEGRGWSVKDYTDVGVSGGVPRI